MTDEREEIRKGEERRRYFRVDDVISVVANPIDVDKDRSEEFARTIATSRAFSLTEGESLDLTDENSVPHDPDNKKLYEMMTELKAKLDFIINQFMLEKEGLSKPEKKFVNISASGIRFTVDTAVKKGDIMDIKLLLPTYPPVAVFAYGEVIRAVPLEDGKYEIALDYINMSESVKNEIIQYAFAQQRETIRKIKNTEDYE
ncbi:MAG: PilZ domain-containing protein [Nitrospiraceae bacterium]|nr:MAG: PilZ domain-containing protein [Nitrospiraceae bacterium]